MEGIGKGRFLSQKSDLQKEYFDLLMICDYNRE